MPSRFTRTAQNPLIHNLLIGGLVLLCMTPEASAFGPFAKDITLELQRGDEALYYREYTESETYYNQAHAKDPKSPEPLIRLGQVYYQQGKYRDAWKSFAGAAKHKLNSVNRGYVDAAVKSLKTESTLYGYLERTPAAADTMRDVMTAHWTLAKRIAEDNQYMSLVGPHLEFLLENEPENFGIETRGLLLYMAEGYYLGSNPAAAGVYYERVADIIPHDYGLHQRLGDIYAAIRYFDKANIEYRRALREVWRRRSAGGNEKSDWTSKQETVHQLLDLIKSLPVTYGRLDALAGKEDYDEVLVLLKRRLELYPSDVGAMVYMGSIFEEMGKYNQARRLYKKALKIYPEFPEAHFYMGRYLLLQDKKFEDAALAFERYHKFMKKVMKREESADRKTKQLQMLTEAARYTAYVYSDVLRKHGKAIRHLKWAISQNPENAELYYDLGAVSARARKRISAIQAFRKVIELETDPGSQLSKDAADAIEFVQSAGDYGGFSQTY